MNVLQRLKTRTGADDSETGILMDCLESAANAINARRYPYGDWPTNECGEVTVEPRYQDLQVRIALDMYNRIGAEGETSHTENGIGRWYDGSWIARELLEEITPVCGVVK